MTDKLILTDAGKATLKPPVLGTMTLLDNKGSVTYEPQEDITAYESALIMRMLFRLTLGNSYGLTPDWRAFLEEHKLTRHFPPVQEPSQ